MIKPWILSQKCAVKSYTKAVGSNFFLPVLMIFPILKMNNWHFHVASFLEAFQGVFWFAIGFGLYKFCRAFDGASLKKINIPSFFHVEIYAEQESLPIFSVWSEVILICKLFILSIRKTIRTGKKKFDPTAFVELFTAHFFRKEFKVYDLPKPRYLRNKKRYNMEKPVKKQMSCFCF